jgi:hypothetical protein
MNKHLQQRPKKKMYRHPILISSGVAPTLFCCTTNIQSFNWPGCYVIRICSTVSWIDIFTHLNWIIWQSVMFIIRCWYLREWRTTTQPRTALNTPPKQLVLDVDLIFLESVQLLQMPRSLLDQTKNKETHQKSLAVGTIYIHGNYSAN